MDIHKNARTTRWNRQEIVRRVRQGHERPATVAAAMGVSELTVRKWLARYQAQAESGLGDRSCRPHRMPTATPPLLASWAEALRRQRWTGAQIATALRLSESTVARMLRRCGLARLRHLEPPDARPPLSMGPRGGLGPSRREEAGPHRARRAPHHRPAARPSARGRLCRSAGLRHVRIRPNTPRTNGKAERFIQTLLREWAYRRAYPTSQQRTDALPAWRYYYDRCRGHGALRGHPPFSFLAAPNNLVAVHT